MNRSGSQPECSRGGSADRSDQTGVLRAVQPRAVATRDALLAAGRRLLATRDFDAILVADIAAANGMSVGSFYGRFRDKESYLAVLRDVVTGEWREAMDQRFSPIRTRTMNAGALVTEAVQFIVGIFRDDYGFMLASIRYSARRKPGWIPVRTAGDAFVDHLVRILTPSLVHLDADDARRRIRFGMQMVYGTLVNSVLNDPSPIRLADPRTERELTRMLSLYLELPFDLAQSCATNLPRQED